MIEWLDLLTRSLAAEYGQRPHICALATRAGHPRSVAVRSIVCRAIRSDTTLLFASDARSEKNAALRDNPAAEVLFWMPTLKRQFRLAGIIRLLTHAHSFETRDEVWRSMSDESRATFLWPSPGEPRNPDPGAFARSVPADAPVPANFEVLILHPRVVESVDLCTHPHTRWQWIADESWARADLNP